MLDKVTITGELLDNGVDGILIGGKPFRKGFRITADVSEDVFENLSKAQENGWFKIHFNNYDDYLRSRGRRAAGHITITADATEDVKSDSSDTTEDVKSDSSDATEDVKSDSSDTTEDVKSDSSDATEDVKSEKKTKRSYNKKNKKEGE
jgi:hypothetical protein